MPDAAAARLVRRHVLSGRLRLYVPQTRRNAALCEDLMRVVASLPGARQVTGSPWTGTLLVLYDERLVSVCQIEAAIVAELKATPPAVTPTGGGRRASSAPIPPPKEVESPAPVPHRWVSASSTPSPAMGGPLIRAVDVSLGLIAPPVALALLLLRRLRGGSGEPPPAPVLNPSPEDPGAPRWHALSLAGLLSELATDASTGLDSTEVRRRLARCGPNTLAERQPPSFAALALGQFASVVILALLGAGVVASVLGHLRDGIVIAGILVLNALLGALQDFHADRSLRALRSLSAPRARVVRGGQVWEIPAAELVPGDVVLLREGDGVPADARVVRARNLEIDESLLTGESLPVRKTSAPVEEAAPLAERASMVYRGTSVVAGRGKAVVVATGMATEMGRITQLLGQAEELQSPLQMRMERLVRHLLVGSAALGAAIMGLGLWRGQPFLPMALTGISMAIAAVPEGLPVFVTVAQAAAVRRMARRQMLVRRLSSLETLARATILCCDKTGTLTHNEMQVRVLTDGETVWRADAAPDGSLQFYAKGRRIDPREAPTLTHLLTRGVLSTTSRLIATANGDGNGRLIQGSRTGAAFLMAAEAAGLDLNAILDPYEKVAEAPFDTARRDNRLLYRTPKGRYLLVVKGAPEAVLPRCVARATPGGSMPLTEGAREAIRAEADRMARDALRVLAIACLELETPLSDAELETAELELAFSGLIGLMDPPRSDVSAAIRTVQEAGVRLAMITGDHPETARAIADELGLAPHGARVLTGPEIDAMDAAALAEAVRDVGVYARVTPEHKLRIVAALKELGECVAMTGDGVNDAPAVRMADVGISMGRRGAEVTRQAAALVITDDRFPTLLGALAEGRGIQRNLRRGLGFLLGGNVGETIFVGGAVAAGLPMPLLPGQILLLNLLSDALPVLALVSQPPNDATLRTRLNRRREPVVAPDLYREAAVRGAVTGLSSLAAYTLALRRPGFDLARARSVGFAAIVGQQLLQILDEVLIGRDGAAAGEGRRVLGGALLISAGLLAASLHLPWMQRLFAFASPGLDGWGLALGASATGSLVLLAARRMAYSVETAPHEGGEITSWYRETRIRKIPPPAPLEAPAAAETCSGTRNMQVAD